MASFFDKIYAHSPLWIQNLGISAYGLVWRHRRFGGGFKQYVDDFISHEYFSYDEWLAYQTRELQKLLVYAEKNVPYYHEVFKTSGLSSSELANISLDQLVRLPLLEKDTIRSSPDQFLSQEVDQTKLHTYLTSGTSGTPLAIKFTSDMHRHWSAGYEVRARRWAGLNYKMSRAMIGGRLVVPKAQVAPPFWRYNIAEKQLYMSAFHISPKNARYYVKALNHYRPDYLVGYASSHFFLARMINEQGLDIFQPKAVLTSSEKLFPEMRDAIEKVYRCPVFDGYSGVEACCQASECEHHNMHISPDVGIIELVDEHGKPVKNGEVGEVVATGLLNFEQPLIRYRTGDMAIMSDESCSCGRGMPILKELTGRLEDTVIGPDGQETVRFHGVFVGLQHVREGQVIQKTYSKFCLRLAVEPEFDDDDRNTLYKRFEDRLGPIELEFELVDRIERNERGKFRAVISHVQRISEQK